MATTEAVFTPASEQRPVRAGWSRGAVAAALFTPIALLIQGYHPFAEDGGVYLAGVKRLLHPSLYPQWNGFVTAHLHFSLFAPMVAWLVRSSHLGLMTVVAALYALATGLTLFAGWSIVERCSLSRQACWGAVALLAVALTVPVAGTSLMLMDPYVTARSLSTPLGLLALAGALDVRAAMRQRQHASSKSIALCVAALVLAAAMHPLMAAYSLGCVLLLLATGLRSRKARMAAAAALCACAIVVAACCAWFSAPAGAVYAQVAHTRGYWFLATWHWYEWFGLLGPLLVLGWAARLLRHEAWRALAQISVLAGVTAVVVAIAFARWNAASFTVAMLQPLRVYETIYAIMLLALGAVLGERLLRRSPASWAAILLIAGVAIAWTQVRTFPHSPHLELPWSAPQNPWEQALLWVRGHTPRDAVFALDANYVDAPGEDSQNFRAIAERSALPDYAKDGGIASIAPDLSPEWLEGERAQDGLDHGVDPHRLAQLRRYGVTWFVVTAATPTSAACPYANGAVKVCRVPN